MNKPTEMIRKILKLKVVKYGLVGATGATLDFFVYSILIQLNFGFINANVVGYTLGTLWSFTLNRKITFKVKDLPFFRMLSFFGVSIVGLASSTVLLSLFVNVFNLGEIISKLITLPVIFLVQFTLNSLVTFAEKRI